jgi:hypothetical protein
MRSLLAGPGVFFRLPLPPARGVMFPRLSRPEFSRTIRVNGPGDKVRPPRPVAAMPGSGARGGNHAPAAHRTPGPGLES